MDKIKWPFIENIALIVLCGVIFYLTRSWWSLIILLFINTISNKDE